jgi:hypothetical protein
MDDDQIIAECIAGKSVRATAKAPGCSVAQVNHVIDAWVEEAIDDQLRKRSLCLELGRLDQLMEVFYRRAVNDADVHAVFWSPSLSSAAAQCWACTHHSKPCCKSSTARPRRKRRRTKSSGVLRKFAAQDRAKDDDPTMH